MKKIRFFLKQSFCVLLFVLSDVMSLYERSLKMRQQLMKDLGKSNIHEVPHIEKIIIAMGIGSLATRKGMKDFSSLQENLRVVTAQQPQMLFSKKSVSNFKLREGMPAMLRCTLRKTRAYDFLDRLVIMALPRLRDFEGLSVRKFDGRGNYSMGFRDLSVFPELSPEDINVPIGLQMTICSSTDNDKDAEKLLTSLGVVFKKK